MEKGFETKQTSFSPVCGESLKIKTKMMKTTKTNAGRWKKGKGCCSLPRGSFSPVSRFTWPTSAFRTAPRWRTCRSRRPRRWAATASCPTPTCPSSSCATCASGSIHEDRRPSCAASETPSTLRKRTLRSSS